MPKDGHISQKIGNVAKIIFFTCNQIRWFIEHDYTSFHIFGSAFWCLNLILSNIHRTSSFL